MGKCCNRVHCSVNGELRKEVAPLGRTRNGHVAPVLTTAGLLVTTLAIIRLKTTKRHVGEDLMTVCQRVKAARDILEIVRVEAILLELLQRALVWGVLGPRNDRCPVLLSTLVSS